MEAKTLNIRTDNPEGQRLHVMLEALCTHYGVKGKATIIKMLVKRDFDRITKGEGKK